MNEDLHQALDGEREAETMDAGTRAELDSWSRMLDAFQVSAPSAPAPAWLEQRVMAEIDGLPEPGMLQRVLGWLVRPADVRVSPLAAGLAAAVLTVLLLRPLESPDAVEAPVPMAAAEDAVVYVQFILDAPQATTVSVAGDFSAWEPTFELDDVDGDGVWTGRVPVEPGVHTYMFLIDGTEWATDPRADRYQDDGFGNQNAVLAVASGE